MMAGNIVVVNVEGPKRRSDNDGLVEIPLARNRARELFDVLPTSGHVRAQPANATVNPQVVTQPLRASSRAARRRTLGSVLRTCRTGVSCEHLPSWAESIHWAGLDRHVLAPLRQSPPVDTGYI